MKRKLYLLGMFAATAFLTACSQDVEKESKVTSYEVKEPANYEGEDFITVAESGDMELLLQPSTGTVRWLNTKTGEYLDSRKQEGEYTDSASSSNIIASYYAGSAASKYNTTDTMESYEFGIQTGGIEYEKMENGVRFKYTLGSDAITYQHFPTRITNERMEELVLQYLDAGGRTGIKDYYRQLSSGVWVRSSSADNPLRPLAAKILYGYFYEQGHYNEDELLKDNTEHGFLSDMPSSQQIEIVVEFTLDDGDLLVNIPTKHLVANEEYPVRYLQVLPYFMTSTAEEGYLFVPDGSGSLINLSNQKLKETQFSARYYGGDILQKMENYVSVKPQMMLPVYGMKSGDFAVLGVIEEGAQVAELSTYIKNILPNNDCARESLTFYINDAQELFQYMGAITKYTMVKCSDDSYVGDISLRYSFLTGDDADYTGMAKRYQELLVEDGTLGEKVTASEDAPLFLNLLGELDKVKYFLGIPYDSSISLTSFEQAKDILSDLAAQSISNIIVKYDGVANGGMNQRAVEKVKLSSRLGGSSAWKELLAEAEKIGAQIYPSFDLATAYTRKNLSKDEVSYTLLGQIATIYTFDEVEHMAEKNEKYVQYIIAPNYIESYVSKFAKSFDKLGVENVASTDFMTFLSPDYRNEDHVSQTTAKPMYLNALKTLADKYNVMLSNPMVDAYSMVDYLTDIPVGNSEMKILDSAVPFTQLVLEGYITYSADFVNKPSESIEVSVMRAMEGKSALNFRLIDTATSNMSDTTLDNVFFAEYDTWKEDIVAAYNTYNEFYQLVKDATIVDHQVLYENDDLRRVEYSNGVKVYFNYGSERVLADGVRIEAQSYAIVNE